MIADDPPRTGVLILRVWVEVDARRGLRVRITEVEDLSERRELVRVTADVDEVCAWVREFLERFAAVTEQ